MREQQTSAPSGRRTADPARPFAQPPARPRVGVAAALAVSITAAVTAVVPAVVPAVVGAPAASAAPPVLGPIAAAASDPAPGTDLTASATAADNDFGDLSTYAGGTGSSQPQKVSVRPVGLGVDGSTVLVVDSSHRLVRTMNVAATSTGVAAGQGYFGAPDLGGLATGGGLGYPTAVAAGGGNRYLADPEFARVWRVDAAGVIYLFAGTPDSGFGGDGGPAVNAKLDGPAGLAVAPNGDVYIADRDNNRVRKVTVSGVISTVAGNGAATFAGDGGPATAASLKGPGGLAVDGAGNLFIADTGNHRVRMVNPGGTISTVAGNGTATFAGDGGTATSASLNGPEGVAITPNGALVIADTVNHRVRTVVGGLITTFAGTGTPGFSGDGGAPTAAKLSSPVAVVSGDAATIFIADRDNSRVRRITANQITTAMGNGDPTLAGQNLGASLAQFQDPAGVAVDPAGNRYVADLGSNRVVKIDTGGTLTVLAGTGVAGSSGDGGPATAATLDHPVDVAVDPSGNAFVVEQAGKRVRRIDAGTGVITTYAGGGGGGDGVLATLSALDSPVAVAVNNVGTVYIADSGVDRVRYVNAATKIINTAAGTGVGGYSGDGGPGPSAQIDGPSGLAFSPAGALLIADSNNARIRQLLGGVLTTVAGTGSPSASGDGGPAASAAIGRPRGLAVDSDGALYFSDSVNAKIRRVAPAANLATGTITTVAGNGATGFLGDGAPAMAGRLAFPSGVAVQRNGTLLVADRDSARVRAVFGAAATSVRFHAVTPQRVLDSRTLNQGFPGIDKVGPAQTAFRFFSGIGPVPGSATAVVMNVTVTDGTAPSYLSVYPAGDPNPGTANLNFGAGQTVPNLVTVRIPPNGQLAFFNKNGSVHVIADVVGYYDDGTTTLAGDLFTPTAPTRILDSRPFGKGFSGAVPAGGTRDLVVAGTAPVPADATAVVLNVTVTQGTAASYLTVYPKGQPTPTAANLLFAANQTVSNLVTVKLGAGGAVTFFNQLGSVYVIGDVVGYYRAGTGSRFHPISPVRLLDSRFGTGGWATPWGPGADRTVTIGGANGIPANATGVVANLTVTDPSAASYLTAYPTGTTKPTAANLVWGPSQTIPNLAVVALGGGGGVNIFNQQGTVDVIADGAGYFAAS